MYYETSWRKNNNYKYEPNSETHLKPCQISKMGIIVKIVNKKLHAT